MKSDSNLPPLEPEDISEFGPKSRHGRKTLLFYFVAGVAVAFLTPENILQYPWARGFVNFMSFIPYVDKVGQASSAHPIAPFFAAVMCVLWLAVIRAMWPSLPTPDTQEIVNRRIRIRQTFNYSCFFLFIFGCLAFVIFYPSFDFRQGQLQVTSRIGMGMYGTIILEAIPIGLMMLVMVIRNWRHIVYGDMVALLKQSSKF